MTVTTVKKPSENSPLKRAKRRRCERKQTPPKPCKSNERKELGENRGSRQPSLPASKKNRMMKRRAKILLLTGLILLALGAALARRIHTWGRPVPVAYQRVAATLAHSGGDRSWTYLRRADGHRTIATDSNGDGTVDAVLTESNEPTSFLPPAADDPQARWLVVCLDGVPYQEMLSLWEEGYFREFFRPVPLIAPFPSESEIALTEAFQSGPVPGYEHSYFDRTKNKLAGGMLLTFSEESIPYLDLFDYDMGGIFKGMAYICRARATAPTWAVCANASWPRRKKSTWPTSLPPTRSTTSCCARKCAAC